MIGIDTHAHVFARGLELAETRRYTLDYGVLAEDYLRQLDENDLSHGVLVQPSFLGTDNGFMLAARRRYPNRQRGIAVVAPDVTDVGLAELSAAGVVGIRLNLIGRPLPDLRSASWRTLLRRVAGLGLQVELHREARDLPGLIEPLLDAGVNVVVDHFGRPDPALGVDDPGFRHLLSMAETGRVWVKLSGAYRNGTADRSDAVARDAASLLRNAFGPRRLLWGSDWPHIHFERVVAFRDTLARLDAWLPNPAERAVVLGDVPAELFRIPPSRDWVRRAPSSAQTAV